VVVRNSATHKTNSRATLSACSSVAAARSIARLSAPGPPGSSLIARRGYTIALLPCDIPFGRRVQTSTSLPASQLSRVLASSVDLVANLLTGSRRRFLIAGALILI
jgi:hypothetical protein